MADADTFFKFISLIGGYKVFLLPLFFVVVMKVCWH